MNFGHMDDDALAEHKLRLEKQLRELKNARAKAVAVRARSGVPAERQWWATTCSAIDGSTQAIREVMAEQAKRRRVRKATNIQLASVGDASDARKFVRAAKRVLPNAQYMLIWHYALRDGAPDVASPDREHVDMSTVVDPEGK